MASSSGLLGKSASALTLAALATQLLAAQAAIAAPKGNLPRRVAITQNTTQFTFRSDALAVIILDTSSLRDLQGSQPVTARSSQTEMQTIYDRARTAAQEYGGHYPVGNAEIFSFKVNRGVEQSYIIECSGGFQYKHFGSFSADNWQEHRNTFMCRQPA